MKRQLMVVVIALLLAAPCGSFSGAAAERASKPAGLKRLCESRWLNGYYLYSFSPGEERVAFVLETGGNTDIWSAARDGSDLRRLTAGPGQDILPSWSPDGRYISYLSNGDGEWSLYVMKSDGSSQKKIFPVITVTPLTTEPVWSPDSSKLIVSSFKGSTWDLWLLGRDGRNALRLTHDDRKELACSWMDHGNKILFASTDLGRSYVCLMNADGTGESRLTGDEGICLLPAPSPDGSEIAFVRGGSMSSSVETMHLTSGKVRDLTASPGINTLPKWSPSGGRIAFLSSRSGAMNVWSMDRQGQSATQLSDQHGSLFGLKWMPSGIVSWVSYLDSIFSIIITRAESAEEHSLIDTEAADYYPAVGPSGSPAAVTWNVNGKRHIKIIDAGSGEGGLRFESSGDEQFCPAFSPDGMSLAFMAKKGDILTLMKGDFQKGAAVELTRGDSLPAMPVWAPRGESLAFIAKEKGRTALHIWHGGKDSSFILDSDEYELLHAPCWSPDGEQIALVDRKGKEWLLKLFEVKKGSAALLLRSEALLCSSLCFQGISTLYYAACPEDREEIWRLDIRTGKRERVANSRAGERPPSLSAGGGRLVFTRNNELWSIDGDDAPVKMPLPLEGAKVFPVLSPDGKTVLFLLAEGNTRDLYQYYPDYPVQDEGKSKKAPLSYSSQVL
ncbi:MAG: hypothetical protein RDV48_26085 [Candidatus Eremiobacteraeota bacterium]|nr:hypothetical protein [Candidatus Eremiobacteraeota bacterium]